MLKWLVVSLEDQNGGTAAPDGTLTQDGPDQRRDLAVSPPPPSLNSPRRRTSLVWGGSCSPERGQSPQLQERKESRLQVESQDGSSSLEDVSMKEVEYEGWVWKQGGWPRIRPFEKRWFVLSWGARHGYTLAYYASQEDAAQGGRAKGSLIVADLKVEPDAEPPTDFGPADDVKAYFAIEPSQVPENEGHVRRIVCGCERPSEKKRWVECLAAAAAGGQGGKRPVTSRSASNGGLDDMQIIAGACDA